MRKLVATVSVFLAVLVPVGTAGGGLPLDGNVFEAPALEAPRWATAEAEALANEVLSSVDPEAAFLSRSAEEQAVIIDWVLPVAAEEDMVAIPDTGFVFESLPELWLVPGCYGFRHTIRYENIFGFTLFSYGAHTNWCHNGTLVTEGGWACVPSVSSAFWRFDGHTVNTGGVNNSPAWNTVCSGRFTLSVLSLLNLLQRTPTIYTRVTGSGLLSSTAVG